MPGRGRERRAAGQPRGLVAARGSRPAARAALCSIRDALDPAVQHAWLQRQGTRMHGVNVHDAHVVAWIPVRCFIMRKYICMCMHVTGNKFECMRWENMARVLVGHGACAVRAWRMRREDMMHAL
eukprot:156346-Chlamydomonas_euryale.AAC.6